MRVNRRSRLDPSQVSDRRGGSLAMPTSRGGRVAVGGGFGGVLLLLVVLLLGGNPAQLLGGPVGQVTGSLSEATGTLSACDSGDDVEANPECRFVAYVNSVNSFWTEEFAAAGADYQPAQTVVFEGGVRTACGTASSESGPFYCPTDQTIYFDIGFFRTLQTQFGGSGGDFAEAYVIAHEYGHHVSNLAGQLQRVQTRQGPDSDAVRLELQADCFAGVWAAGATQATGPNGEPFLLDVTEQDIREGLDAARVVGDDYIQERFAGTVSPETWTHGTSEQRQRWFLTGFDTGDLNSCDTFSAAQL